VRSLVFVGPIAALMKRKRKDPMTLPNLTLEQRAAFAELLAIKDQDVLKR